MTVVRERDKGGGERHFNTVPRLGFPIECRLGIGGGDQQAGFEAGALIPLRHIGDLHQRADRKTARLVGGGRRATPVMLDRQPPVSPDRATKPQRLVCMARGIWIGKDGGVGCRS